MLEYRAGCERQWFDVLKDHHARYAGRSSSRGKPCEFVHLTGLSDDINCAPWLEGGSKSSAG